VGDERVVGYQGKCAGGQRLSPVRLCLVTMTIGSAFEYVKSPKLQRPWELFQKINLYFGTKRIIVF
jgi:hypothetical protein